jgi:hypothetical protein
MTTLSTMRYRKRYRHDMAVNVRMSEELAEQLRRVASELGKSQQEAIREAIELYVRDFKLRHYPPEVRHLVTPAKRPYQEIPPERRFTPPPGSMDSTDMIREMRGDR